MRKMLMLIVLLVGVPGLLSGCLGLSNNYQDYAKVMEGHSAAESARIQQQSAAIADAAVVEGATKTEAVLLATIAMMQIERLGFTPLPITAPTTGYDVLDTLAGHVPFMSSTFGMYKVAERGLEAAGNVTAETINADDSFNATEVHATGDGNAASASQQPSTEVVAPELEPMEEGG